MMASSKEPIASRPQGHHRHSIGAAATALPVRQHHARTNSQSLSAAFNNSIHRVNRRKSMSSTSAGSTAAMVAAAVKGAGFDSHSASSRWRPATSSRANTSSGKSIHSGNIMTFPSSLPPKSMLDVSQAVTQPLTFSNTSDYIADTSPISTNGPIIDDKVLTRYRTRRASEGSRAGIAHGKKSTCSELKCEKCGKEYKHSSCLTKHLWEHTPEWELTSKLLISKHQQVQLLEAASVLVAMNQEPGSLLLPPDAKTPSGSDQSLASPVTPRSSELQDYSSSANTTPPPSADFTPGHRHRHDLPGSAVNQGLFSTSFQSASAASTTFSESAPPNAPGYLSHYRQWSMDSRPVTASTSVTASHYGDEDQAELSAAVGLLSCSFGTPKSGPLNLPSDIPPVPPLPAKFLVQNSVPTPETYRPSFVNTFQAQPSVSYFENTLVTGAYLGIKMDGGRETDLFRRPRRQNGSRGGSGDEDDDGVFGRMDE